MLINLIITLGWCGVLAAIAYFIWQDHQGVAMAAEHMKRTRQILMLSAGLVAGGYILKYLGRWTSAALSRCKKCGKRIPKTEMFCYDHSVDLVMKAKDRDRFGDLDKQHLK
jgi:hypothetical protein